MLFIFKIKKQYNTTIIITYKMSVDIVNLIESNPITKFSGDYQSKLVEKVKNQFTNYEQQ